MNNHLRLFVYGSLKVGECNAHVITRWLQDWQEASTCGEMRLRPDGYPALYLSDHSSLGTSDYDSDLALDQAPESSVGHSIQGQVLTLAPGAEALAALDSFEGYFPGQASEYLRVAILVDTPGGRLACWTYTGVGRANPHWPSLESWPPPGHQQAPEPYHHGL